MKVYRFWTNSNHKIQYTLGYFATQQLADLAFNNYAKQFPVTASGPDRGIDEIEVITEIPTTPPTKQRSE